MERTGGKRFVAFLQVLGVTEENEYTMTLLQCSPWVSYVKTDPLKWDEPVDV
jgi:hypothetical protein